MVARLPVREPFRGPCENQILAESLSLLALRRWVHLMSFYLIVAAFPGISVFPEEREFDARIDVRGRNIQVFADTYSP